MSDDLVNLKVPRTWALKLEKRARKKDPLKTWAAEAREILQAAVSEGAQ